MIEIIISVNDDNDGLPLKSIQWPSHTRPREASFIHWRPTNIKQTGVLQFFISSENQLDTWLDIVNLLQPI